MRDDASSFFRRLLSASVAAACLGALVAACNAHVETTCYDGLCTTGAGGTAGSTTSAGGTGGHAGSGGSGGGAPMCSTNPESGDIPCDVFDVLKASCQGCHNAAQDNGAPIDLLTCDRFHQKDCGAGFRLTTAQNYVMTKFMPLGTKFPVTDAQRKTLQDWLDACAPCVPAGTGCTETPGTLGCYKMMP